MMLKAQPNKPFHPTRASFSSTLYGFFDIAFIRGAGG